VPKNIFLEFRLEILGKGVQMDWKHTDFFQDFGSAYSPPEGALKLTILGKFEKK